MATIKAVSSKCKVSSIIDYVTKDTKTDNNLISGKDCTPETAKTEMQATKCLWGKTDGRTYKHFVQSFHQNENITPEQAHEVARKFAESCKQFKGFEVLIATHTDREHIHTHFVLNSVSFEDGHKFQMHSDELQQMKNLSDKLCNQRGLHICEKGKTFEGTAREETSAYSKEAYQLLKKAEQGEVKSYVQDIALAVLKCREQAVSRDDFIQKMSERGYGVDWQDSHKYITFIDFARQEQGEKQCKVRNNKLEKYYNMDFGKDEMEHEFEINARSQERTNEAREQLEAHRGTEPTNHGVGTQNIRAGTPDIGAFLSQLNADERAAEQGRADREAERKRLNTERQREIEERERRLQRERTKKRSYDRER